MGGSWAGSTFCTGDVCIWSLTVSSWVCKLPAWLFGTSGNGPGEVAGDVCNLGFLRSRYHTVNATRSSRKTPSTVTQTIKELHDFVLQLELFVVLVPASLVDKTSRFTLLFDTGTTFPKVADNKTPSQRRTNVWCETEVDLVYRSGGWGLR